MDNTFLKDHVYINMSKKYSEEFEELIGDINNVLESKIGMRICYDKNDSHMNYSTKPQEDCFSGFAILRDNQKETQEEVIKRLKNIMRTAKEYEIDADSGNDGYELLMGDLEQLVGWDIWEDEK
tara:strand:- start:1587 stop:1958 length:372 start_codon:yes stop_codon:yes gene_type:complete